MPTFIPLQHTKISAKSVEPFSSSGTFLPNYAKLGKMGKVLPSPNPWADFHQILYTHATNGPQYPPKVWARKLSPFGHNKKFPIFSHITLWENCIFPNISKTKNTWELKLTGVTQVHQYYLHTNFGRNRTTRKKFPILGFLSPWEKSATAPKRLDRFG